MIEHYDPQVIGEFLGGRASEAHLMVKLMAQVFGILVIGIVLWRLSSVFSKKKKQGRQSMFADSSFQNHWKKR